MKKIIMIILALTLFAAPAYAENLNRQELAETVFSVIKYCNWEDLPSGTDKNDALCAALSCGLIENSSDEGFYTEKNVTNMEFTKCMVAAWEIRFGGIDGAGMGASFSDYSDMSEYEKGILDKAVMLGIVKNGTKFSKDSAISKENAEDFGEKLIANAEIMKSYGMGDEAASFRNDCKIVGSAESGRIYFYKTYNKPPEFDKASLVVALYDGARIVDVSCKNYTGLCENEFSILHASVLVPQKDGEYRVKAFMLDSLQGLKPIYEYKLI